LTEAVSLWDSLSALAQPVALQSPEPMEYLDQDYGYILYRAQLRGPRTGRLSILGLHDRAQVFLDGKLLGVLDRNHPKRKLALSLPPGGRRLDILVENQGRVNFGPHLLDRKGILGGVLIGTEYVFGWQAYPLPLADLSALRFAPASAPLPGPAFYRGTFRVEKTLDTFLALPGWTKGAAWVNGFHLGRYWKIGPQRTLYVPAPALKVGSNELVLFEQHGARRLQIELRARPRL
jgi:beta-galactosidase